ncbi:transposase [Okeania hirsuta]
MVLDRDENAAINILQ